MLARAVGPVDPEFVDWLAIDRFEGREMDIGMHRRWLDPMKPVADIVLKPSHGVLATSATLRSGGDWANAEARTGAVHLDHPAEHFSATSPFDYAAQAEVLIVTDIKRGDMAALAGAYAALIGASGGGALGLFTAIRRLRSTYARIADRLARAEIMPVGQLLVEPRDLRRRHDLHGQFAAIRRHAQCTHRNFGKRVHPSQPEPSGPVLAALTTSEKFTMAANVTANPYLKLSDCSGWRLSDLAGLLRKTFL
eukprot:gene28359-50199_t